MKKKKKIKINEMGRWKKMEDENMQHEKCEKRKKKRLEDEKCGR